MRVRSTVMLCCWLIATSVLAEFSVVARTYNKLDGASGAFQVGGNLYFLPTKQMNTTAVCLVRVDSEAANVVVEAEDLKFGTVDVTELKDEKLKTRYWEIVATGRIRIEVNAVDFEKNIWDRKKIVHDLGDSPDPPGPGPGPDPGPGPNPPPDPSGPFDGIASRVAVLAKNVGPDDRNQIAGVMQAAADKMLNNEFVQLSQARDYISRNWPKCQAGECRKIYDLIANDASTRKLGWQEIQLYYREIAKGVQ